MPPTKPTNITDQAELEAALHRARETDDKVVEKFGYREKECDKLSDEIIQGYTNDDSIQLSKTPDLINCSAILAAAQRMSNRITQIYADSIRISTTLKNARDQVFDALLPNIQGGNVEERKAKARSCLSSTHVLINAEEGLQSVCETVTKNLKNVQEYSSRQIKAIELDINFLGGVDPIRQLNDISRGKFYTNIKLS